MKEILFIRNAYLEESAGFIPHRHVDGAGAVGNPARADVVTFHCFRGPPCQTNAARQLIYLCPNKVKTI